MTSGTGSTGEGSPSASMPVSVVLERRLARSGQWTQPQWEVVAVVAGEEIAAPASPGATLIHEGEGLRQYLWAGLRIDLHKDGCESYWYNLQSETPYVFVVCVATEDDDAGLRPRLVTASQDEANAHMEVDDPVYSVPMPAALCECVERYVVANYVPVLKKKRKRTDWLADSKYVQRPR